MVYGVTSLNPERATPGRVLDLVRGHWHIENKSHWVRVLDKLYEGGRTVSQAFKKNMPIIFEKLLPKWNYWALPQ